MHYYLYEIRNNINNKIYVGVHKTDVIDDGYMGSGKVIKRAIEKHGIDNFTKTILETFNTSEAMFAREKEIVTDEFLLREDTYNLRRGGTGGFDYINSANIPKFAGKRHSASSKEKIRVAAVLHQHSDETKNKISSHSWAKTNPAAQKEHASRIALTRQVGGKSEEEKQKISAAIKLWWQQRKLRG